VGDALGRRAGNHRRAWLASDEIGALGRNPQPDRALEVSLADNGSQFDRGQIRAQESKAPTENVFHALRERVKAE
jgi:hypothetical protein